MAYEFRVKKSSGRAPSRSLAFWGSTAIMLLCATGNAAGQSAQPAARQSAAQEAVRAFDIPAQSLAGALSAFNRQTGIQVTQASGAASRSLTVNAVRGRMTPQQALSQMLGGTGISWQFTGNDAVVVGSRQTIANGAATPGDGATVLDTITVAGKGARNALAGRGFQGQPDWVYETPAAVSVISQQSMETKPPRQLADVVRDTPGVYTEADRRHPGASVNIRGIQNQGRIVTTIDDARQNFRKLYAATSSQDRAFVDPNLLRGADIEKTRATGVGGAGALGGVINFRTIEADDIIRRGQRYGAQVTGMTGGNEYSFSGSLAAAAKITDDIDIVAALSRKKIGDFKPGQNGLDRIKAYSGTNSADTTISKATEQEVTSGLAKATWKPTDDQSLKLSYIGLSTDFAWATAATTDYLNYNNVKNHTFAADYAWNPENSRLIDLSAKVYYNRTLNSAYYPARITGTTVHYCPCDTDVDLDTVGGFIRNTSEFSTGWAEMKAHYGAELYYDKSSASAVIGGPVQDINNQWFTGPNANGSDRLTAGLFSELSIRPWDWFDIRPALRYDHWKLTGAGQQINQPGGPMGWLSPYWENFSVDRSAGKLSPTLTVAVEPYEGIQLYGKYLQSYRPPQLQEVMFSGLHLGTNSLLTPLRFTANPWLEPEEASTIEFGVNARFDDVFRSGDALRLKASVFDTRIDQYVTLARVTFPGNNASNYSFTGAYAFVNLTEEVHMRGLEAEASYDTGLAYLGMGYTYLDADFGDLSYNIFYRGQGSSANYPASGAQEMPFSIAVPPRHKVTVSAGMRFLDEQLTLGARLHHVSETVRSGSSVQADFSDLPAYTTIDLHGAWNINDHVTANIAVENLTDVAYGDALGTGILLAPGRTVTGSLKFKF